MVVVTFCLLGATPLLLFPLVHEGQSLVVLAPVSVVVIYSALRLSRIAGEGSPKIIGMSFWIFVYIFLGVAPLFQIASDHYPWFDYYDELLITKAGIIVIAGLVGFDVGQIIGRRAKPLSVFGVLDRPLKKKTLWIFAFGVFAAAVYFLYRFGGMSFLMMTRVEFDQFVTGRMTHAEVLAFRQLTVTPIYVVSVAMLVYWLSGRISNVPVSLLWKCVTLILLTTTIILNNPINSARLKVGTIALSLMFILPWSRRMARMTMGALICGIVVVFPYLDLFRSSLDKSLIDRLSETSPLHELVRNPDFDAFQMVVNAVDVVERNGVEFGRQLVGSMLFWVPRSVWADKPVPTGQMVAQEQGYSYTNLSLPLWGEFYVDAGWILLLVGFVGYGYFASALDRLYGFSHRKGVITVASVLVPIYGGYQFFLLRGPLMPALAYLSPLILFSLLCSVRVGRRR